MRAIATTIATLLLLGSTASVPVVGAVEPLSGDELAQLCTPADADEPADRRMTRCESYLLGFLDGALRRVADQDAETGSFIDRAARTRLGAPPRGALTRFPGYCLETPLPLDEVIAHVRDALARDAGAPVLARDLVDETLRRHFPCPG